MTSKLIVYFFSALAVLTTSYLAWTQISHDSKEGVQEPVTDFIPFTPPSNLEFAESSITPPKTLSESILDQNEPIPDIDRIKEFFNLAPPKLPIVETVTYSSRVPWQKGKPAWLADYAAHYKTSRHFIARSLNQKPDYLRQDVREGDRFNVLKTDCDLSFYLVLDMSRLKMFFYYLEEGSHKPELVKAYSVSAGRKDPETASGYLTPFGTYTLGDKVAIYDPKKEGFHQGKKIAMVKIFGTRWIPFEEEVENCTASAKGYGLHGMPWIEDPFTSELREDLSSLGSCSSDGCIRLKKEDMEELFSIIISRPTTLEIVPNFQTASLLRRG